MVIDVGPLLKYSVTVEFVGEVSVFAVVDSITSLTRVETEEQRRIANGSATATPEIETILRVPADDFPLLAAVAFTSKKNRPINK